MIRAAPARVSYLPVYVHKVSTVCENLKIYSTRITNDWARNEHEFDSLVNRLILHETAIKTIQRPEEPSSCNRHQQVTKVCTVQSRPHENLSTAATAEGGDAYNLRTLSVLWKIEQTKRIKPSRDQHIYRLNCQPVIIKDEHVFTYTRVTRLTHFCNNSY